MTVATEPIRDGSLRKGDRLMVTSLLGGTEPVFDRPDATHVVTSVRRDGTVFVRWLSCIGGNPSVPYTYCGDPDVTGLGWCRNGRPIRLLFARVIPS